MVLQQAFKDVELAVRSSRIERFEDLCKHKDVEDYRLHNRVIRRGVLKVENLQTTKVNDERDGNLISRLEKDLLVRVDDEQ